MNNAADATFAGRGVEERQVSRVGRIVQKFRREIEVYRRVLADRRTPRLARWLLGAAVAYAVSPIDLIPDFIPVIGHLDDAIILPLLVWLALRSVPPGLLADHRAQVEGERAGR